MEEFLQYLKDNYYSDITISEYKGTIKKYQIYIKFKTPTKKTILEFSNNNQRIKSRLTTYYKFCGYDFFAKTIKIDADIKNFIDTLDYVPRTKKYFTTILQKYKHTKDKIEFIKSYKVGKSRDTALTAINQYRKYKKEKPIKLTSL